MSEKNWKNVRTYLLILMSVMGIAGITFICMSSEAAEHIVINEICSNNFSIACDENGKYSDYVELYNPSWIPVSLSGFSVSDSRKELRKCNLDSVLLRGRGYYIIWLDGSEEEYVGYASFKLSKKGESIYLCDKAGNIIDSQEVPGLEYNTVYARKEDGSDEWCLQKGTVNYTNQGSEEVKKIEGEKPVVSVPGGFYEDSIEVSISADSAATIYYTLDGSDPDLDSEVYQQKIIIEDASCHDNVYSARDDLSVFMDYIPEFKVDKATVLRAAAYNEEKNIWSPTITETYFINYNEKNDYNGYAVISLVTDPINLFDEDTGIYGNGITLQEVIERGETPSYTDSNAFMTGREWEREATFQFFDVEHKLQADQSVGIRISGQSTRNATQKSFNIYARDIYDDKVSIEYDFFGCGDYTTIKVRNGGSAYAESKILDPFLQSLAENRDVAIQRSTPSVVFLNGEYWGIYNIRERYKEEYFEKHYDVNENNIWMIDAGTASIGGYDAYNAYQEMIQFISENDMTNQEMYHQAENMIDMQSLIDYYCINLYIDNNDMAFDKNMAVWRTVMAGDSELADTRWRWALYDMDGALYDASNNSFETSEWWKEDFDLMDEPVIKSLMQNADFREQFRKTFEEISEEVYGYDRVHAELIKWKNVYEKQVVKSNQRFISENYSADVFDEDMERIDTFFQNRKQYILQYLEEELALYEK